jgi:hypothetical protein
MELPENRKEVKSQSAELQGQGLEILTVCPDFTFHNGAKHYGRTRIETSLGAAGNGDYRFYLHHRDNMAYLVLIQ